MLRNTICAVLCTLLLTSPVLAQGTADVVHRNNQATFEELERQVIKVDYFETRSEDILAELQTTTSIVFKLDESAADNNFDEETLISCRLKETRLATALEFILGPFQCTWKIQDGMVVILSEDAALDTGNYGVMTLDCADLISKIRPVKVRRRKVMRPDGGFGAANGRSGPGGVFSVPGFQEDAGSNQSSEEPADEPKKEEAAQVVEYEETLSGRDQLIDTIIETVDPDSWIENGGLGTIMPLNDVLVIRQTQANLRRVKQLLGQLREIELDN